MKSEFKTGEKIKASDGETYTIEVIDDALPDKMEKIGMQEIIGVEIDKILYFGKSAFEAMLRYKKFTKFISRRLMKMMDACDLGPKWGKLAEMPTLFYADSMQGATKIISCDGKKFNAKDFIYTRSIKTNHRRCSK